MPSAATSQTWFVRITAPWTMLEPKINEVKGWTDLEYMAVGYHIGGKTKKEHVHVAIKMLKTLQKQSIDVRFKKLFGVKGADYSSKVWDGSDKVLSYLYHDKSGKIEYFKLELSAERLAAIQRTADIYEEIVTTAKAKASTRIPDQILMDIKESGYEWSDRQVVTAIVQGITEGKWYNPGSFMIERYSQEVLLRQEKDGRYASELVHQILERIHK